MYDPGDIGEDSLEEGELDDNVDDLEGAFNNDQDNDEVIMESPKPKYKKQMMV